MRRGRSVNFDPQMPLLAQNSPVRGVDDLRAGATASGQGVCHDRDLPPHLTRDLGCELGGEFLGECSAEFFGDTRRGHQAEPDRPSPSRANS